MKELERIIDAGGRSFLFRVETSCHAQDYRMYEELREDVWGFPEDHMSGTRNMMCENFFHEGGSLFIGAFASGARGAFPTDYDHLAAFCYGFTGVRDKEIAFRDPANLRFYSQFAAVRRGFQGLGLGVRLKEFQGEAVRDLLGVGTIICTYDPLTAVNAHRNVRHFGMGVLEYRVATYGEYGGHLNRLDVPTDRFLMSWDLNHWAPGRSRAPETIPSDAGRPIRTAVRRIKGRTAEVELEVVEAVEPDRPEGTVLVRIPADFYLMLRETDIDDPEIRRIPFDWRSATRRTFTTLLAAGYAVVDFRRPGGNVPGGEYVLKRKELL